MGFRRHEFRQTSPALSMSSRPTTSGQPAEAVGAAPSRIEIHGWIHLRTLFCRLSAASSGQRQWFVRRRLPPFALSRTAPVRWRFIDGGTAVPGRHVPGFQRGSGSCWISLSWGPAA